eukprot:COSAG06_NODE_34493_length_473_cov_17.943850_1_plen_121_part_01
MRTPRPSRNDSGSGYSCKHTRAAGAAALGGSRRTGAACVAFFFMENRSCRAWKPRADGERLGLIGAAASMEAGQRRSMLEARPFAVRTTALAHGLCGYVQVAAAEGPACIVAAESGGWLPF